MGAEEINQHPMSKSRFIWIPFIFENARNIHNMKGDIKEIKEQIKQIANNVQKNIKEVQQNKKEIQQNIKKIQQNNKEIQQNNKEIQQNNSGTFFQTIDVVWKALEAMDPQMIDVIKNGLAVLSPDVFPFDRE